MPSPTPPVEFAHQSGQNYLARHGNSRGCYLTPPQTAMLMAQQIPHNLSTLTVLDPGSGAGILSAAICQSATEHPHLSHIHVDAWETSPALAQLTLTTLEYAKEWLRPKGISLTFAVNPEDFLLQRKVMDHRRPYDAVISNPPYRKLSRKESQESADNNFTHGHPNAYTAFMAHSIQLLRPEGTAVFLVPRSFTSGRMFQNFRKDLFRCAAPTGLHLFKSRTHVFKDQEVLQENLIITLTPADSPDRPEHIRITHIEDTERSEPDTLELPTDLILQPGKHHLPIPIPVTHKDISTMRSLRDMPDTLASLGLTASTGKVIIFRHFQFLTDHPDQDTAVPLFHLHQITPMHLDIHRKKKGKPRYLRVDRTTNKLLVPSSTCVLTRRFSPKEQRPRIIAAPFITNGRTTTPLALENHLNHIHSPAAPMDPDLAAGIAAYLNSDTADQWASIHLGNNQIGAADLNAMPLPSRAQLLRIQEAIKQSPHPSMQNVNAAVASSLDT